MSVQSLSLIIFAFNEARNIGRVVEECLEVLPQRVQAFELILVDDGSTDETYSVMEALARRSANIRLLRHAKNQGIGSALRTGYQVARYNYISFLPADNQIRAMELPKLFDAAGADIDVVSTYYSRRADNLIRRVSSRSFRVLQFLLFGLLPRLEGTYLFRREVLERFHLVSDSFALNFEFIIRSYRAGCRFAVVEIECSPRLSGASKVFSPRKILFVLVEILALRKRLS